MGVFGGIAGANTNETLQGSEADALAPKLAAHGDAILLDAQAVCADEGGVGCGGRSVSGEDRRLLEVTYLGFVRAGAELGVRGEGAVEGDQ